MTDDIWLRNKATLIEYQSHLKEDFLKTFETIPRLEIMPSAKGHHTVKLENKWLHSKIDPEREAIKFVESQSISPGDFVVCYGFALGYHLKHLLNIIGQEGFLYIVELNLFILKTALMETDFSDVLKQPNVTLITHTHQLEVAKMFDHYVYWNWDTIASERKKMVIHRASFEMIPSQFDMIKSSLSRIQMEREGDNVFCDIIRANLIQNIPLLRTSPGFSKISLKDPEIPVIVAGAGPSLDLSIEILKRYQDQVFVMAVDSALKPLSRNGIRPDMVISVDPQSKTLDHFDVEPSFISPVVGYPTLCPEILQKVPLFIPVIQAKSITETLFGKSLGHWWGETQGGSSVSVIAVDLACQLFRGPVILSGFDFSFPELKGYASNTSEMEFWHRQSSPFHPLSTVMMEYIYSKTPVKMTDKLGRFVMSFQSLVSYKITLETLLSSRKKPDIYTYGDQGLEIKQTKNILFEDELIHMFNPKHVKHFTLQSQIIPDSDWEVILKACREIQ